MLHAAEHTQTASQDERLSLLSNLLGAVAVLHAPSFEEGRQRARAALTRMLRTDPGLDHFPEVVAALQDELAQGEVRVARVVAEPVKH